MTLFIHIGLHHTGTTALQQFLYLNKSFLEKNSIFYPETGLHFYQHALIPGCFIKNHDFLPSKRITDLDYYIDELCHEISYSDSEIAILSSEVFSELIKKDINKVKIIFEKLKKVSNDLEIVITTRNLKERSLSQYKAMLRLSSEKKHFRKQIFDGPKLFHKKINNPEIFIEQWEKLNIKINKIEYNNNNMIEGYFNFFVSKLSGKNKENFLYQINKKSGFYKGYKINIDDVPQYVYLLIVLVGLEIKNTNDNIEEKLNFTFVKNYCDGLMGKNIKVLSKIDKNDLMNFLTRYHKHVEEQRTNYLSTIDLINTFKFKKEIAYQLTDSKEKIIRLLIN